MKATAFNQKKTFTIYYSHFFNEIMVCVVFFYFQDCNNGKTIIMQKTQSDDLNAE